ncbi:MAG: TetR/AcrR family transcriptional regulator [Oscillospiraceae bacterium]
MSKVSSTKEKIIYESLNLFSQNGYDGVSMRDIACSVGIKATSVYNHFNSKADIFSGIIKEMSDRYESAIIQIQVPNGTIHDISKIYSKLPSERLQDIAKGLFLYFLKDDFASKFRKMLVTEQYRNEAARVTFLSFFINGALQFQSELFFSMINSGTFQDCDSKIMALHFYSPIFLLLNMYDHQINGEEEALILLSKHVAQFSKLYCST